MSTDSIIYLDNCSTTKILPEVVDEINRTNEKNWANPSSAHRFGFYAEQEIDKARKSIANIINTKSKDVCFTSGGTEANNLAILGLCRLCHKNKKKIITTKTEHKSILRCYEYAKGKLDFQICYIDVYKNGLINLDHLINELDNDTLLVSCTHVNNETGIVQSISEIGSIVKSKNTQNSKTMLHVDAVQSFGKFELDCSKMNIDFMSMSAHKIHGPKGVGALYIGNNLKIEPLIFGGGQERNIRSGTENVAGIIGFATAASIAHKNIKKNFEYVSQLRRQAINLLKETIPNIHIISEDNSSPYILNFLISGLKGGSEIIVNILSEHKIYVSAGSACSSHDKSKGHVLRGMGYGESAVNGSIRLGFSVENTITDIKKMVTLIHTNLS